MEQDRYPNGPDAGLYGCDRDLFQRVWQRVMPEEIEGCPIELNRSQDLALPVPAAPPAAISPPNTATRISGTEQPADAGMVCLGESSAVYSQQLQDFIVHELADHKLYRALARQSSSGASNVLSGIAADEYRHAKRLSTAYFLISGVHYCPENVPAPCVGNYLGTLRRRFAAEQQGEAAYLAAADQTQDPCLHELYLELAWDEANHARLIRSVLEQQL